LRDLIAQKIMLDAEASSLAARRGHAARTEPFGRQAGARAAAVEQPTAQSAFQRVHAARDGGLRHAQPVRRAVEAARLAQIEEGLQKFGLHHRP
jgi:hypothetical protein